MNRSSDTIPIGDYVAECHAPLHFGSQLATRHLECQVRSEYERLGWYVVQMLRTHRRLAMELEEGRESDHVSRRLTHRLRLLVREIPELRLFYQKFEPNLRVPPPLPEPAPKSLLRRLGAFVAEAWEEAGETVRQCKAA